MNRASFFSRLFPFAIVLLAAIFLSASLRARGNGDSDIAAAPVLPLGMDSLMLGPKGPTFSIYASAEGAELSGLRFEGESGHATIFRSDGTPLKELPSPLVFRVTATTLAVSDSNHPNVIDAALPLPDLLRSFRFRLRVSGRALETQRYEAAEVRMIGVPADVPFDERIYRVTFNAPPLPVSDHIILEVLTPEGELVSKFPFDLN